MAIYKNNPPTIASGSILWLDAASQRSYPKSGATWSSLQPLTSSGSLVNTPTFSTDGGGSIVFNGSTQYANFSVSGLDSTATIEIWAKIGSGYSGKMLMGWNQYDIWCGSGNLGFNTANSDVYGISSATVSNLGLVNNWRHYIFEMRSDVSYTNNKIYINSQQQTLSQQLGSEFAPARNFNNGIGRIGSWGFDTLYLMPMNCVVFRLYNRSLTNQEIQQNYNALKSRYGLI